MLEVRNLSVAYGGLRALTDVSLSVAEGQFVTVVGPNGAGKSTLFKTICGIVAPVQGSITFWARICSPSRPSARAHLGIAHVPEGPAGVQDTDRPREPGDGRLHQGWPRPVAHTLERIHTLFPILSERASQLAGTLSGGEQQMLAIGRGLASAPKSADAGRAFHGLGTRRRRYDLRARFADSSRGSASRSCWWNSAWPRRWSCRITAMCWRPGTWCWTARIRHCWRTTGSVVPISG